MEDARRNLATDSEFWICVCLFFVYLVQFVLYRLLTRAAQNWQLPSRDREGAVTRG